jgi:shikimate kinase/3-dehydroquinate synthase
MAQKPVVLSGFMATGKSTVGRVVAARLGVPFVDTDELLVADAGARTTGELFAREGEARFREREARLIPPLLRDGVPRVIALGGGAVTIPRLRHEALERAIVVTLEAPAEEVVRRVTSLAERPNLAAESPLERTRDLLALRRAAYAECHARIGTAGRSPDDIARDVLAVAAADGIAMPLGERTYTIEVTDGDPARLGRAIDELAPSSVIVVTDENVRALRWAWLEAGLGAARGAGAQAASKPVVVTLVPGEAHKQLAAVSRIWDEALARGVDRNVVVLAYGGGVVGDLANFAASTLLRGVRCVQMPTTLLSMVDSSVGGKTGFDHARGKNLVGSFFQPSRVVADLEHLTTLPPREVRAGLAEIVKIGLVTDAGLLDALDAAAEAAGAGDRGALGPIVRRAIEAKVRVVRDDEREQGARALLNLGHTVGHALEAFGGYGRWLHGEGVAIGTVLELEATERLGLTPPGTAARASDLLARLGLPVRATRAETAAAWPFVSSDKKKDATALKLPVVTGWGAGRVERIEIDALRRALLDGVPS